MSPDSCFKKKYHWRMQECRVEFENVDVIPKKEKKSGKVTKNAL